MDERTTSITFTGLTGLVQESGGPALNSALLLRLRTIVGIVLLVLVCVAMSAADIHVSVTSPMNSMSSMSPMERSYSTCMNISGVPVSISPPTPMSGSSIDLRGAHTVLLRDPYGPSSMVYSGNAPDTGMGFLLDNPEDFNALFRVMTLFDGPVLIVDGVDYSQQYARCLNESGYTAQVARDREENSVLIEGQSDGDQSLFADQVRANNQWAACARNHGWLVFDSMMVPGKWPEVDLPSTITPDQLRGLLVLCPSFDADKARRIDEWLGAHDSGMADYPYPEDLNSTPTIGFQLSPFDAAYLSVLFTDEGRPLLNRLLSLYTVLDEQRMDYIESRT